LFYEPLTFSRLSFANSLAALTVEAGGAAVVDLALVHFLQLRFGLDRLEQSLPAGLSGR